jgi:hypothetical protein
MTVCGQVAIEWTMFWDLRFDPEGAGGCRACADHVRSLEAIA